jgi:predicted TIM-barrel fold metal-dependent hydrolase
MNVVPSKYPLFALLLVAILGCRWPTAAAAAQGTPAKPAPKSWENDPEWQEVRYGAWGGPGVNPRPGPMDGILLKNYAPKSSVVAAETVIEKARFPAIDAHAHVLARTPEQVAEWVKTMDEVGIERSIVLTGATGDNFDKLVDLYLQPYPNRFQLFCGVLVTDMDKPDYPERAAAELARCYRKGARGVGELSDKGWGYGPGGAPRDKRLHVDDPRLDAFWRKCAELKIPANIHVADHPSAWTPLDVYQERTPDYQHFSQWGRDVPSHAELIAKRDRTLARHPKTTFIACHLGNQGHDLATLGRALDAHPNFYLDISARDYEVGRTPRAAARFLAKYQGRIMFGTDMGREQRMYRAWWRLFESADEYMPGRVGWRIYALDLPDAVLKSLYRDTFTKVMNHEKL